MLDIQQNVSLRTLNTFGIDAIASNFSIINNENQLPNIAQHSIFHNGILILGGGSNILFNSQPNYWILKNELKGISIDYEDENAIIISVKGGEVWHEFVMYCVANNYGGIENLSLIPGTVGAAPMQNIGAYGVEVKDVIIRVKCFHFKDNCYYFFNNEACKFGYRDSIFKSSMKNEILITEVTFKLSKNPIYHIEYGMIQQELAAMQIKDLNIQAISQAVINIRSSKLPNPKFIGNAGSFFKNPVISRELYKSLQEKYPDIPGYEQENTNNIKVPAAYLIEKSGWKGFRKGNIGVHEKQSLVLVNYGGGNGQEIIDLSETIIQDVFNKFNIQLEREVQLY